MRELIELVGKTDIYLLDLILSGKIPAECSVLDAGCGGGRNLHYFLRRGQEVFAVDRSQEAVARAMNLALKLGVPADDVHFRTAEIANLDFLDDSFGLVVCNAVLHFARDEDEFESMVEEMWRVLAREGILFCRLTSNIGIENLVTPLGAERSRRWCRLPDGSERFLVDLDYLLELTKKLDASLLGPIKTVNVQNQRCMTNWVLKKKRNGKDNPARS